MRQEAAAARSAALTSPQATSPTTSPQHAREKLYGKREDSPFFSTDQLQSITVADGKLRTLRDHWQTYSADMSHFGESVVSGISRSLADLAISGKASFGDLAKSIIRDFIKMTIQALIFRAVAGMFGGGIVSMAGVMSEMGGVMQSIGGGVYADGAAFTAGGHRAFASGGIVNRPTKFAFAGGTGLMGEAGPEAIMPLKRGADGKLGVQALVGGAPSIEVEVNITNNGQPVQAR
ncbi:MAG TPA: phage tail tape measure C-terminal domain-containing protein [Rhodanobacteraceae bacterium]|nr:phage tail tape measure C-terminal domain-containing protein [Rhodanobacteraceae bacterium]